MSQKCTHAVTTLLLLIFPRDKSEFEFEFEFVKTCRGDKDFHKNCQCYMKQIVAATCSCIVLLGLVT